MALLVSSAMLAPAGGWYAPLGEVLAVLQTKVPRVAQTGSGTLTNVYLDADLRTVLNDLNAATGAVVVADETMKDVALSTEFKNERTEAVLERIALQVGGYWKRRSDSIYLLSKATPEASLFREFATTERFMPGNQTAQSLQSLLPAYQRPYVNFDLKTNIVTITAPEKRMAQILADLEMADTPSRQFILEALVTEITTDGNKDFGFTWSWKNFSVGSDLSIGYDRAGFQDVARLKALIEKREATLRANPRISAFEGRESVLNVGQDTYYSLVSGNPQFPFNQIQLIRTGVTLKFTGLISRDGTITLNLEPEVSDAVVTVNGNPTTNVRRASTTVRVRPGETIAIGGLVQEGTDRRVVRIPLLGSIPLLGELFTRRTNTQRRTETIILITPRLTEAGVGDRGIDSGRKLPPP